MKALSFILAFGVSLSAHAAIDWNAIAQSSAEESATVGTFHLAAQEVLLAEDCSRSPNRESRATALAGAQALIQDTQDSTTDAKAQQTRENLSAGVKALLAQNSAGQLCPSQP